MHQILQVPRSQDQCQRDLILYLPEQGRRCSVDLLPTDLNLTSDTERGETLARVPCFFSLFCSSHFLQKFLQEESYEGGKIRWKQSPDLRKLRRTFGQGLVMKNLRKEIVCKMRVCDRRGIISVVFMSVCLSVCLSVCMYV